MQLTQQACRPLLCFPLFSEPVNSFAVHVCISVSVSEWSSMLIKSLPLYESQPLLPPLATPFQHYLLLLTFQTAGIQTFSTNFFAWAAGMIRSSWSSCWLSFCPFSYPPFRGSGAVFPVSLRRGTPGSQSIMAARNEKYTPLPCVSINSSPCKQE